MAEGHDHRAIDHGIVFFFSVTKPSILVGAQVLFRERPHQIALKIHPCCSVLLFEPSRIPSASGYGRPCDNLPVYRARA